MAFNIGAAIGGAAEELARGMNEKQARLISLTDEAWSDHKTQFQRKVRMSKHVIGYKAHKHLLHMAAI